MRTVSYEFDYLRNNKGNLIREISFQDSNQNGEPDFVKIIRYSGTEVSSPILETMSLHVRNREIVGGSYYLRETEHFEERVGEEIEELKKRLAELSILDSIENKLKTAFLN